MQKSASPAEDTKHLHDKTSYDLEDREDLPRNKHRLLPERLFPLSLTSLLVAGLACLFTCLPLVLFARHLPVRAAFSMFANDTFYYLDVARNSQGKPFYTFDGRFPTNGFHPVWQYLEYLGVKYRLLDVSDPLHAMVQLFYGNLAILGAAIFLLALAASRFLKHQWLALLTVCPGWIWLICAISAPNYLASWSFLNGMETAVELLFLALALLSYRPGFPLSRWLPLTSFFLGMMVLSRLDDVFFLFPLMSFFVLRVPRPSRRTAAIIAAIPFVMIAVYLLYNTVSVGRTMPVSGAAKASLSFQENFDHLLDVFRPVNWSDAQDKASIGFSMYAESFVRILQMVFPMVLSALYLARRRSAGRTLVDWLCVGVLLKGAYNFTFVTLFAQGYWYYGSSLFVSNLIVSLVIDAALISVLAGERLPKEWVLVGAIGEALLVLFCTNAFLDYKLNAAPGDQLQAVVERRAVLAQMVRAAGANAFIEFDDGVLGYATNMSSLSGFGLVSDPAARFARKHGHFFDLAVAREGTLVLSRGGYANQLEGFSKQAAAGGGGDFDGISSAEFREYALEPLGKDGASDVRLYRLVHH